MDHLESNPSPISVFYGFANNCKRDTYVREVEIKTHKMANAFGCTFTAEWNKSRRSGRHMNDSYASNCALILVFVIYFLNMYLPSTFQHILHLGKWNNIGLLV